MYENHVFIVADYARDLSERFGVENDLAEAAAMLHDVADAVMNRFDSGHETKSIKIACNFLTEVGYTNDEIQIVVHDAIANHSCNPNHVPKTSEGKIMATADAKAHLDTDFYVVAKEKMKEVKTDEEFKKWVSEKIDRDFNIKIFFSEIREELQEVYESRKQEFNI